MRRTIYILTIFILLCGIALAAYAPDVISIAFVVAMIALIAMGVLFGIMPVMQFSRGFQTAMKVIQRAAEARNSAAWMMLEQ